MTYKLLKPLVCHSAHPADTAINHEDPIHPSSLADLVIGGLTQRLKHTDFKPTAHNIDPTLINIECIAQDRKDCARLIRGVLKSLGLPRAMVAARHEIRWLASREVI